MARLMVWEPFTLPLDLSTLHNQRRSSNCYETHHSLKAATQLTTS